MGFLDHSTNNIIIDAVLTDYGRQLLAQNNGQFKIDYFSLADDEIDYSVIQKFGRTVGKEKITKNTPIFEAQTKASSAIKNRMITLPTPTVTKMPQIKLSNSTDAAGTGVVSMTRTGAGTYNTLNIEFTQAIGDGVTPNPSGLSDSIFTVFINSRFLKVTGATQLSEEPISRVAAFSVSPGQRAGRFNINIDANSLTDETFNQYGVTSGNSSVITTPVTIIGSQTGLRKDFKITISNTSA